jgi:AraC-like DNA-binding protein
MTPILGQALGAYEERPAPTALQQHFSRAWSHTLPSGAPRKTAIVPDGCADLLWVGGTLTLAGPDREANIETIRPGTTVVGFRFQPGAAAAWLRLPASELVGARLPLENFWGGEARRLADRVGDARSPAEVAHRLEAVLTAKAADIDAANDDARFIFGFVAANRLPQSRLVRQLCDRVGLSERTLRRRCHEAFGYGPKTLDRILRFQRFVRLARNAHSIGLAGMAAEAGYADQSHLTRETRDLAGFAPRAILAQLEQDALIRGHLAASR